MAAEIERGWLIELTNALLIREPEHMLTSLLEILPAPRLVDTSLPQQVELFESERQRTETVPIVIDSKDLLLDPEGMLRALCSRARARARVRSGDARLGAGPAPDRRRLGPALVRQRIRVHGVRPYREKDARVPEAFEPLLAECRELYAPLHAHRIQA
ncbi:MAG: hypothetical protein GY711_11780 [bacterium]|nr:hypothetical protein [bacterium]